MGRSTGTFLAAASLLAAGPVQDAGSSDVEYRVLATSKTSTLEKELNEAGLQGFRLVEMKGGETGGGQEVVAIVERPANFDTDVRYEYRLLATNKTSTMQKELNEAGAEGFLYVAQSVNPTMFGGQETLVALSRRVGAPERTVAYRLLATNRTKTMHKELAEAASDGFRLVGLAVDKTAFGGAELVSILMREQ